MIPKVVKFTGLTLDPRKVLNKCFNGPVPPTWIRHEFLLKQGQHDHLDPKDAMTAWLKNNLKKRFTISTFADGSSYIVVIGFESESDAVMFRLMDGHITWREGHNKFL